MPTQAQINIIAQQAQRIGVDPQLLIAIGMSESGLRNSAKSSTTVKGAFQIQESTWAKTRPGVAYTTDLAEQAKTAAMIMKQDGFTTPELVYTSYNAGSGVAKLVRQTMSQGKDFATAVTMSMNALYKGDMIRYGKFLVSKKAKIAEIISGTNRVLQSLGKDLQYQAVASSAQAITENTIENFFGQTGQLLANLSAINTEKFGTEGVKWLKSKGFKVQNA